MNHYEAFAEAINANPEDRVPQLVFADWLDENGQSDLAEAWRVIVEADRLPFLMNAFRHFRLYNLGVRYKWYWWTFTDVPFCVPNQAEVEYKMDWMSGFDSCFAAMMDLAEAWAENPFPLTPSPMANAPRKAWHS